MPAVTFAVKLKLVEPAVPEEGFGVKVAFKTLASKGSESVPPALVQESVKTVLTVTLVIVWLPPPMAFNPDH